MNPKKWIDIDLSAFRRNLALVRSRVVPAEVMVVVKNDAYGHGIEKIVESCVAEGVTWIGVLDSAVGVALRQSGVGGDVAMFAWLFAPDEDYGEAIDARIDLGVSSLWQLASIVDSVTHSPARIHLKLDTGLGRAGARVDEWSALVAAARVAEQSGAVAIVGAWTHIAEASEDDDSASISLFKWGVETLGHRDQIVRHLAASAASYARRDSRFDLVRVGAFTYGIAPGEGVSPVQLGLTPVMALRGVVTAVGSDGTAVIPIGLIDGMPSLREAVIFVTHDAHKATVLHVDATETTVFAPDAAVGDIVTFFGSSDRGEPTLQEWADALGTIGEEIAVRISPRIERRYVG
ncbi:MAG: alanine racemase [Microbacteriaceae bacterium]